MLHLDTISNLNRTAVRALEAFAAAKCVEFRATSNGNTARSPKLSKTFKNAAEALRLMVNVAPLGETIFLTVSPGICF